jgi:uncharacterized protein (DUF488 family)
LVKRIWTIGHSTRSAEQFIGLLEEFQIKLLVDVRLLPGSRRYPQFDQETLRQWLAEQGIGYEHFRELGGRRKPRPDSTNTAWHNEAFRGYADYMETPAFQNGVDRLIELADKTGPTAIMCAEAVWWRCHRGLIADFLKVRGIEIIHIVGAGRTEAHPFTSPARVVDGKLTYAGLL